MLILYNELNLLHKLKSKQHPQRPERIQETIKYLKLTTYAQFIQETYNLKQKLKIPDQEINKRVENLIIKIHGRRYFDFVEGMWCEGLSKPQMFINLDTYYIKQTYLAAFQAVKTTLLAVQQVFSQTYPQKNVVCLVRPPGHHSGMKNQPHGFSFFNNIAIATNYFVQKSKKKAVIIDWDIHHGQGTQQIFYDRSDVLYISLHRFDEGTFFPHVKQSGSNFYGQKQGKGYNINICWNFPKKQKNQVRISSQTVGDSEYMYCFQNIIVPILRQYEFDAIFVSCGFDCALGDPIGDSKITKQGFKHMTQILKQFKKQMFFVLEGGYNLDALKWGLQAVLEGLSKNAHEQIALVKFQQINEFAKKDIQTSIDGINKFWKL